MAPAQPLCELQHNCQLRPQGGNWTPPRLRLIAPSTSCSGQIDKASLIPRSCCNRLWDVKGLRGQFLFPTIVEGKGAPCVTSRRFLFLCIAFTELVYIVVGCPRGDHLSIPSRFLSETESLKSPPSSTQALGLPTPASAPHLAAPRGPQAIRPPALSS